MIHPDKNFWQDHWKNQNIPWDIGYPSPPIKTYIDQGIDKRIKILIPGCGNAYEAEYLIEKGFRNTFIIDIAPEAIESFVTRFPSFPTEQIICGDFFKMKGDYDLIIEQTFFCAISPDLRPAYAKKMRELLTPRGKLVGLLFDDALYTDRPPYGGSKEEYLTYFEGLFEIIHFEKATNSIKPRAGRELFIELRALT